MLVIKTDKNVSFPITKGKYNGSLIYNDLEFFKGKINVTIYVVGSFNQPFKLQFYKINNKYYYHEGSNKLFNNEIEVNNFIEQSMTVMRNQLIRSKP